MKPKSLRCCHDKSEAKAAKWLYQGGGGNEVEKGDEKAASYSFFGLVSYLAAYERYLKESSS